jgi:hypothetical protein
MKKLLLCIGLFIAVTDSSFAQSFTATKTEIKQGENVVANYTRKESRGKDNKVEMVMTFTTTDGNLIATATIPYRQAGKKTTIITKDGKQQTIILKAMSDRGMAEEIATQLSTSKYL